MNVGSANSDNPVISGALPPVTGSGGTSGSSGVNSSSQVVPTDSVETLNGETPVDGGVAPDPGRPILRESLEGMTAAQLFAMTFSAMDRADQQRAQSALTTGPQFKPVTTTSTSTIVTHTPPVHNSDGSIKDPPKVKVNTVITTDTTLLEESTLGEVPNEPKAKKSFYYPPVFSDLQNIVQTPEGAVLLMPALSLLGTSGKVESFDTSDAAIDAATAVAYAEYTQGLVNSGAVKDLAMQSIPNDPVAASQLAAGTEGSLLKNSVDQVGQSIGMNGLSNQVQAQTFLVADAIKALSDPSIQDSVIEGINMADLESITGMNQEELNSAIRGALDEVSQQGPFYNLETMSAAFQASLSNSITNSDTVSALIAAIQNAGINLASQTGFDVARINLSKTEYELSQAIMKNWSESIDQTAADSKAASIVHEILNEDILSRYQSAQDVQRAIVSELKYSFPEMDNATAQTISESLYKANSSLAMSPSAFKIRFRNQYEAYLGIGPESSFGRALEHAVGISNPPDQTSYTALMNQSYEAADEKGKAFLDPGTSAGAATQQARLYDPGYQLVNQWSAFMDTSKMELNAAAQRTFI